MATNGDLPGKMRALRANKGDTKAHLELIDIPKVGGQDVLIKVKSAGLAPGPYTLLSQGRLSHLPTTMGHQAAGVVEAVGSLVRTIQVGQRVRLYANASCGKCNFCTTGRDQMCVEAGVIGMMGFGTGRLPLFEEYHEGGLADYIRVPEHLVDVLPDNVSFDVAAKLGDLANAIRVLKVAELTPGATVIITAPTGTMGTCCVKLATFFGIAHLILVGRSTERLEAVKKLSSVRCNIVGYDSLGDDWQAKKGLVQKLRSLVPEGVDTIIDFTPSGADHFQTLGALAVHGSFVHMGGCSTVIPLPLVAIMANCWKIIGTRNHSRTDAKTALKWLKDGRVNVDDLITHRYNLDEIDEALTRLHDRSLPVWGMVVNP